MSLWGIEDSVWQPFQTDYQLSKPPAVQALYQLAPSSGAREQLAQQLAQAGYTIDVPIDVWGWPALQTMQLRETMGYTWVPSALQPNVPTVPGADLPGLPPYDPNHPPAGSIKVSVSIADYPPFTPPAPPPPAPTNIVGALEYGNVYTYGPGAIVNGAFAVQNGLQVVQNGVTYTAHSSVGLMGPVLYFTTP